MNRINPPPRGSRRRHRKQIMLGGRRRPQHTLRLCQHVLRSSMSTPPRDFNAEIIEEFRANEGRVGGMFESTPLLLLHHTGAKSNKSRINPLAYLGDGGRYVVFASKGGAPTNPDWYHNLKAHPNVTIEVGPDTIDAAASEAKGEERERLYRTQAERAPQFAEYAKLTERVIPVVVLTPTAPG
jgi:deazaflavin-dependent oxidoreductase (nitroreductase family)